MDEEHSEPEESPEEPKESLFEEEEQDGGLSQTPIEESSHEATPLSGLSELEDHTDLPEAHIETPEEEDSMFLPATSGLPATSDEPEEKTGYEEPEESGYQTESYETYSSEGPYEAKDTDAPAELEDEEEYELSPIDDFDSKAAPFSFASTDIDESSDLEDEPEISEETDESDLVEEGNSEAGEVSEPEPVETPSPHKLIAFLTSLWFMVPLILVGIGLRGVLYWRNRALWLDEGFLTTELLSRSFRDLLEPLGIQSAPIGFLLTVRTLVAIGGAQEYVLRAFPLFASCAMLVALLYLGRRSVYSGSLTIALALGSFSLPLILHGSEFKQYASDGLWATVLLWACAVILRTEPTKKAYFGLGALGVVLIWMSHPMLFVAAGAGLVLGGHALLSKKWNRAGALALVGLAWAGSFSAQYFVSLRHYAQNSDLQNWHVDSFLMFPPDRSWPETAKWLVWTFVDMFSNPLGMTLAGFGVLGFLVGTRIFWKQNRAILLMFMLPIVFALTASYFGKYPFSGRFLVFASPALLLVTASGLNQIAGLLWQFNKTYACVFIVTIFIQPVMLVANAAYKEPKQGVRPVVAFLEHQYESGDTLYLYHWLQHEFRYYAKQSGFEPEGPLMGTTSRRNWRAYRQEIEYLKGQERVWLAFVRPAPNLSQGDEQYFVTTLNGLGTQMDKQVWGEYTIYLYDLTVAPQESIEMADWLLEMEEPSEAESDVSDEMPNEEVEIVAEPDENSVEVSEN